MLFFKDYIMKEYGKPLYRVPIDLPLSCPHRVKGGGKGCIYCPEDGARARHLKNNLDLKTQVETGIKYIRSRYGEKVGLIAYFQSFTNTNAPIEELKKYYSEVLSYANFAMVIISTRPDCLPDDVLNYLSELNGQYELWIELGVQSANDATLELINRQHDFKCVKDAVAKLAERNIKTAAHVIIGLPGEDICDFRNTAAELAKLPFSGIKIHNLLVLKNTPLASMYHQQQNLLSVTEAHNYAKTSMRKPAATPCIEGIDSAGAAVLLPMNEYEYADALIDFLKLIPSEWPLMRITADAPPEDIIAPKWWMKKGQFIEYIRDRVENPANFANGMPKVKTEDGSYTLYHPEYKQHFHSLAGAETEAEKKFIEPCEIRKALNDGKHLKILDIGFGLGTNALAAVKAAEEVQKGSVSIISLEKDLKTLKIAAELAPNNKILATLAKKQEWSSSSSLRSPSANSKNTPMSKPSPDNNRLNPSACVLRSESASYFKTEIKIILGDARQSILTFDDKFDAIFLDPFSHEANPELWTYDFIHKLAGLLAPDGVIATYSAAFPVRGAMLRAGLTLGETPSFGRKKGGTIASFANNKIISPLPSKDLNIILKSTAGTPYRDPDFSGTREKISDVRKKLVKRLQSKGIPKWYKTNYKSRRDDACIVST